MRSRLHRVDRFLSAPHTTTLTPVEKSCTYCRYGREDESTGNQGINPDQHSIIELSAKATTPSPDNVDHSPYHAMPHGTIKNLITEAFTTAYTVLDTPDFRRLGSVNAAQVVRSRQWAMRDVQNLIQRRLY